MRSDAFKKELGYISEPQLRSVIRDILNDEAPDYFYKVPSSSTGKWHPQDERGEGGLVLHTRRCVAVGMHLCRAWNLEEKVTDLIVAACLIHDLYKNGKVDSGRTDSMHPYYPRQFLKERGKRVQEKVWDAIILGVECHSGRWSPALTSTTFLGEPFDIRHIVHLADFICSRENIIVDPDNDAGYWGS